MGGKAALAVDCATDLGESPVWHHGSCYFVDINGKRVFDYEPASGRTETLDLPELVGNIVPRASGGLIACLERTVVPVNVAKKYIGEPILRLPDDHIGEKMRFNDGKVDPQGRLWAGTMHLSWRDPAARKGKLYKITPGRAQAVTVTASPGAVAAAAAAVAGAAAAVGALRGRSRTGALLAAGVAACAAGAAYAVDSYAGVPATPASLDVVVDPAIVPNGMAWSADSRSLFWIDSGLNSVERFDFDPVAGAISGRRTLVKCPPAGTALHGATGGVPDGMTIDAAGKLWVVLGESGCVVQYDPETGREMAAVRLPVKRPTACCFGGADLSILYVTTRAEPGSNPSPHHGGLFAVTVPGVRGASEAAAFAG